MRTLSSDLPVSRLDHCGFTVVELVTVLSMCSLIMATLAPTVLRSRESSRGVTCSSNLRNIGNALHGFHDAHDCFPKGFTPTEELEPFLPAGPLEHIKGRRDSPSLSCVRCPTDIITSEDPTSLSYCWNEGGLSKGQVYGPGFISLDGNPVEFSDGMAFTAAASESLVFNDQATYPRRKMRKVPGEYPDPLDWSRILRNCEEVPDGQEHWYSNMDQGASSAGIEKYLHAMPPNGNTCISETSSNELCTADSDHSGGVYLLVVDGAVRFISDQIDPEVWGALGTRDGGEAFAW